MAVKQTPVAQNPLILRCNRLIEAFAKSDDERDFYLDRIEGFLVYADFDKSEEELGILENELKKNNERYCMIPKLTFYETKKIMEGFINEKVYDIDTKEKLLDVIQSKEARENFLEFIYDHHSELEKWQTFYQERSRIRIIEWLRANHFDFVFEEDLDFPNMFLEKLKKELFQPKVGKEILSARKTLFAKSKTYYSNEALNPRPKRGRPPKQIQKTEIEPQITSDIYTTVPQGLHGFLFIPDLTNPSSATFSSKFGNEEDLFTARRGIGPADLSMESFNQKLIALRSLSSKWIETEDSKKVTSKVASTTQKNNFDDDDLDEEPRSRKQKKSLNDVAVTSKKRITPPQTLSNQKKTTKVKAIATPKKASAVKTPPKSAKAKPATPKLKAIAKAKTKAPKATPPKKQKTLRPIMKLKKKKT